MDLRILGSLFLAAWSCPGTAAWHFWDVQEAALPGCERIVMG